MKLTVILLPCEDGGYTVVVPSLPGVVTEGDTLEEALANAREASLLAIEIRVDDGTPGLLETPERIANEIESCMQDRAELGLPPTFETREIEIDAEITLI